MEKNSVGNFFQNLFKFQKTCFSDELTKVPFFQRKKPSENSEFKCEYCGKNYSTKGNLKNHLSSIHLNNKPFKCQFPNCNKSYINKSLLNIHYISHTGNRQFICRICGKKFIEKSNLRIHLKTHSNQRPYICEFCGKSYKIICHLKEHINLYHLKIKKFKCPLCDSSFGRKSTLNSHLKTHTGEKNFLCPIFGCKKFFAEKGNMIIHFKRHFNKIQRYLNNDFYRKESGMKGSLLENSKHFENNFKTMEVNNKLLNFNVWDFCFDLKNNLFYNNLNDSRNDLFSLQINNKKKLCFNNCPNDSLFGFFCPFQFNV